MSDPEHWSALFGELLGKLVSGAGWYIEIEGRAVDPVVSRMSEGLDRTDRDRLQGAARQCRRSTGAGGGAFTSPDVDTEDTSEPQDGLRVFSFQMVFSSDQKVRVAMLLRPTAFQERGFRSELDFVGFCRRLASFFVSASEAVCQADIFRQIAASISLGGVVADRNGNVVMNIGGRDGDIPANLKPVFASPDQARKLLRQVVLDQAQTGDGTGAKDEWPAHEGLISTGGQDRCVLHAIPVRGASPGSDERRLLFAVLEPCAARCPSTQSLRRVYSLTPAEARVVERLVKGLPIKEISRVLKLSDNTVRTYLKRSFEKVGVCSQQQLIYAVTGMASEVHSPWPGVEATAAE